MHSGKEIGTLSQQYEEVNYEWTIKDIFSYTVDGEFYCSPLFSVSGSQWYLKIYPKGDTSDESVSVEWISLYLMRKKDCTYPKTVNFSFGIKKMDGTIETFDDDWNYVFDNAGQGHGISEFLNRQTLMKRKIELVPSGALTIICTLRVRDFFHFTSKLVKLSEDLRDAFISKRGCDATLKVKHNEFQVHKSILGCRSRVFASMFDVDMKEKNTGVVDIPDCHPEDFKDFLTYLYSGMFENTSNDVFEQYRIADKYDVEELKSDCVLCMVSNLSVDNVFDTALLGHQFDQNELQSKTQDFFNENFAKIVPTAKWDLFLTENLTLANKLLKNMVENMKLKK